MIIILIYSVSFSHLLTLMVFLWSLSDSKSPQVSRTLLGILLALFPVVIVVVVLLVLLVLVIIILRF